MKQMENKIATRRVFAVGETLLDIIFKNGKPVSSTPGGSMLNTAVSLGRLGLDVQFISEYGNDMVGVLIDDFLRSNGVGTEYVCRYDNNPSSLALAFLDDTNNADYTFYKHYPEKRLDIDFPELNSNDIVLFGSFYGIDPKINTRLKPFLEQANEKQTLVIYDPNFRKAHLSEMDIYRPIMMENFARADIVKGSDEDFELIFGTKTVEEVWTNLTTPDVIAGLTCNPQMCDMLIYTANKANVSLRMQNIDASYSVPPITPISAIGAGDSFNAGLIYGLISKGVDKGELLNMHFARRSAIINSAIQFAGHVCMSYDNYISPEFAEKYKGFLKS